MRTLLLIVSGSAFLAAQTPLALPPVVRNGSISGTVLSELDRQPLRRVLLVLCKQEQGALPITVGSDDKGLFRFDNLTPGQYTITASREGLLTTASCRRGAARQPALFSVYSGTAIDDVTFFLENSGVIAGKVVYDDGEAALGAEVKLYRAEFRRGQRGYFAASSARSNFRGEYSMYGLPPGTYFLCAEEAPVRIPQGAKPQQRLNPAGEPMPDEPFVPTFYPSSPKLSQSAPIVLRQGQEASHLDIRLVRGKTLRIRGRVMSLESGKEVDGARFALRRADVAGLGSIEAAAQLTLERGGRFELYGVSPGEYELRVQTAEGEKMLSDHLALSIGESDLNNVEIRLRAERPVQGIIHLADLENVSASTLRVSFEPRSDAAVGRSAIPDADGLFQVKLAPDETYDLYLQGLPQDGYLSQAKNGSVNLLAEGLYVPLGGQSSIIELTAAASKAQVNGRALVSDVEVAAGVFITLVPDFAAGRLQAFRGTSTNGQGDFLLQGLMPGRYLLYAWNDDPPCEFFDPDFRTSCPPGTVITVEEGKTKTSVLRLTGRR